MHRRPMRKWPGFGIQDAHARIDFLPGFWRISGHGPFAAQDRITFQRGAHQVDGAALTRSGAVYIAVLCMDRPGPS